jgi:hypothetical protein
MFLALVIAASVAEGEREGVKIVSPPIALYAFDKIVGNVAAGRNEVCSLIVGYPWPYAQHGACVVARLNDAGHKGVLSRAQGPSIRLI